MHHTSSEDFFLHELIPTAQLIELLLALSKHSTACLPDRSLWSEPPPKRRRLMNGHHQWAAGVLYQPLHVLAVYCQNPDVQMGRDVTLALQAFRVRIWDQLTSWPEAKTRLQQFIAGWTNPAGRANASLAAGYLRATSQRIRSADFTAALQALESDVARLTGFKPADRHAWLTSNGANRLQGAMADGRISGWRTFVRNGDWAWLARDAKTAYQDKTGVYRNMSVASRAGISEYAQAWTKTFSNGVTTPANSSGSPAAATAVADNDALPRGVTVVSSARGGVLLVEAVYDPHDELNPALRQALLAYTPQIPRELAAMLQARKFAEGCGYRQLVDAVERATAWQQECSRQLQTPVRETVQQFVTAQKHAELRMRLLKQFNRADLADLKQVLESVLAAEA